MSSSFWQLRVESRDFFFSSRERKTIKLHVCMTNRAKKRLKNHVKILSISHGHDDGLSKLKKRGEVGEGIKVA